MNEEELKETEISLAPHLALTHNELQNGAANGRNVSLLMKAQSIPEELVPVVERVFGHDIVKSSQKNTKQQLEMALKAKFIWASSYSIWVEDFDEKQVLFSVDDTNYHVSYTRGPDGILLGEDLKDVKAIFSYEDDNGKPVYRREGDWPNQTYSFVLKGLASIEDQEKLAAIFKKNEQEKNVEELGKVQDLLKQEQAKVEALEAETAALKEEIAALKADVMKASVQKREDSLKAVLKSEDAVASLLKATATLDDEAFEAILKSHQVAAEALESSDLFKRNSDVQDEEKNDSAAYRAQLIKSKFLTN